MTDPSEPVPPPGIDFRPLETVEEGHAASEVLAEVWLYLDGECDKERRAVLVQHLDECSPCLAEYGLDDPVWVQYWHFIASFITGECITVDGGFLASGVNS